MEQSYMKPIIKNPEQVLSEAIKMFKERGDMYGSVDDMFKKMARRMSISTDKKITPFESARIMVALKEARIDTDPTKDSLVDSIVYQAIATYLWSKEQDDAVPGNIAKGKYSFDEILNKPTSKYYD